MTTAFQMRLIPSVAPDTLAASKLHSSRANLRVHSSLTAATIKVILVVLGFSLACSPLPVYLQANIGPSMTLSSPTYNNLLSLESHYSSALEMLHSIFACDGSGALREATVLLKMWVTMRSVGQVCCFRFISLMLQMSRW